MILERVEVNQEDARKMQELISFMSDSGIDGVNYNSIISLAICETYREFSKVSKFQKYLNKKNAPTIK